MKLWLTIGALSGFLSVALGAFAAHGLQARVGPAELDYWVLVNYVHCAKHTPFASL